MTNKKVMRGDRLHIAIFGNRNAGKSSLINALTKQKVSIVSDTPGTTADPVYKSMELHPIGPVVIIDTAGLDDFDSKLGKLRVDSTEKILKKTDIAIVVISAEKKNFYNETELIKKLELYKTPFLIVINKSDLDISSEINDFRTDLKKVFVSALNNDGLDSLKKRVVDISPTRWEPPYIKDLISPGQIVVLVAPIDLGAPKGRLIMPQVKAIREILDADGIPVICKERELISTLDKLKQSPSLIITDSQVFNQVAADVSKEIPITSFSILSARQKGDLKTLIEGLNIINHLKPGDNVLIAEACTHHPMEDDIARVKIPRWLANYCGGALKIETVQGFDFPDNLDKYKLVIHCGGCTLNRKEMKNRLYKASQNEISITNFGLIIAYIKSVFPRAIEMFKEYECLFESNKHIEEIKLLKEMALLTEI